MCMLTTVFFLYIVVFRVSARTAGGADTGVRSVAYRQHDVGQHGGKTTLLGMHTVALLGFFVTGHFISLSLACYIELCAESAPLSASASKQIPQGRTSWS